MMKRRLPGGIMVFTLAFLLASAGGSKAQLAQRLRLTGHVPAILSRLQPVGSLPGSNQMKLAINLSLRDSAGLESLQTQLYDPASLLYHHFLTPEQFDARFGPTEADYQSVITWATRNGFTITGRHPNHMLLEVSASVSDIQRALQITLRTYQHPTENRIFFAPDQEPSLDTNLPVTFIAGLENFARPHPKLWRHTPLSPSPQAVPKIGSGPNGILSGFDYRSAYAPGIALTGAGQQVGLLEFDGFYTNDIISYISQTGVSNVPVQVDLLDGFNGTPSTNNVEVALDIEMAISMAPGLSKVVVFESDTNAFPNNMLQAMSTNTLIKQFSCSWDFGPITAAQRTAMDTYFQKFSSQGQSFFDASGDTGATNSILEPPDDDPYITQVGGTTLAVTGPGGAWLSEISWNAGYGPGYSESTGGTSANYLIPEWQTGVSMTANKGSTVYRNYPDVAMAADNIFIVADDGYDENASGTSCAAPLWAGFTALVNQRAATIGGITNSVGFINPAIYNIGTNSGYTACLNDITFGNNTNFNATQYFAVPGFDLCTGWGSPAGSSLLLALTQPDGFQITPGRGPVANGPAGGPFSVTNLTLILTNTGKAAINWTLGATSTWVTVSSRSGTLNANTTASVTLSLNPSASLLPTGVYSASLWFTNLNTGSAQLRQFTVQIGQELALDGGFEAGDFCYWSLSGSAGIYSNNFVIPGESPYEPYAGNYLAALGEIGDLSYLSQPVPTRPGQIYRLSLWLENPTRNSFPNQFEVQWNTNASAPNILFNQSNMGKFAWSNFVFVVQTTTNVTTLQIASENSIGFFGLDNISVQTVPAPSLQIVATAKNSIQLNWSALPNVSYQPQSATNLVSPNWVNLGGTITATTNSATLTQNISATFPQFYRVELLP